MKRLVPSAWCAAAGLLFLAPDLQAQAPGNGSATPGGAGTPRRAGGPQEHARQIISKYDKDDDHALNVTELAVFFEALRHVAEQHTPPAGSGSSSGSPATPKSRKSAGSRATNTPQEQAARAIEKFDTNGTGKLEASEIVALLRAINEKVTQEHGGQPAPAATPPGKPST